MTRAVRLSFPSPTAELEGLAAKVFAVAVPAAAQSMNFNASVLDGDLFRLECDYDPSEPWPFDHVAVQLAAWRLVLVMQSLNVALFRASWSFARMAASLRPERWAA